MTSKSALAVVTLGTLILAGCTAQPDLVQQCFDLRDALQYEAALAKAELALQKDPKSSAAHRCKATTLVETGQLTQAVAPLDLALRLAVTDWDRMTAAGGLGRVNLYMGNYRESGRQWELALELARKLGNRLEQALALDGLGSAHEKLGEPDRAIAYYQEALRYETRDRFRATILINLAIVYDGKEDFGRAIENAQEAIRISERLNIRTDTGKWKITLGNIYRRSRDYARAEQPLAEALALLKDSGERYWLGQAHLHNGLYWSNAGKPAPAAEHLSAALNIFESVGAHADAKLAREELALLGAVR